MAGKWYNFSLICDSAQVGDQTKENEMSGKCGTNERGEKFIQNQVRQCVG